MLEQLFGSKTRVKLLRIFLNHPDRPYYVRELTRELKSQINAVRRELENLESMEIIMIKIVDKEENKIKGKKKKIKKKQKKFFIINQNFILYPELKALMLKAELLVEQHLIKKIKELGNINYLVLTGVFVGLKDFPVDILAVGKVNPKRMKSVVKKFERDLGREINYTLLSAQEFKYRRDITDKFLYSILDNKKVVVVDQLD
jgi:23S rRNA pseudoU1915 N3-methylase RlmH